MGGFYPNTGTGNYENGIRRSSRPILPDSALQESVEVSESDWTVPPISCQQTGSEVFPIYVQLGPAAGHRGNQGSKAHFFVMRDL